MGRFDEAIEAQESALECRRSLGNVLEEGDSLRALSRLFRYVGRTEDAAAAGREAVALLEQVAPGHELAIAYCSLSHLYMSVEDAEGTLAWGARALELAERLNDTEACVYALINIGRSSSSPVRPTESRSSRRASSWLGTQDWRSTQDAPSSPSFGGHLGVARMTSQTATSALRSNTATSTVSISGACI